MLKDITLGKFTYNMGGPYLFSTWRKYGVWIGNCFLYA